MKTVMSKCVRMFYWMVISLVLIIVCQVGFDGLASSPKQPISIEDLVSYTRIRNACLSPDGRWVAYLAIKPQIADNRYHCTLFIQEAKPDVTPAELARFYTIADQTFDRNTGALKNFGGQFLWSANSHQLVYTKMVNDKVQVWLRHLDSDNNFKLAGDFPNAELIEWDESNAVVEFKVSGKAENSKPSSGLADPAMHITDDTDFWTAPWYNPPLRSKTVSTYRYNILSRELVEAKDKEANEHNSSQAIKYNDAKWPTKPNEIKYARGAVLSPDRQKSAFSGLGVYNTRDIEKAYRDYFVGIRTVGEDKPPKEFLHTPHFVYDFQWKGDSKEVYALLRDPEYTTVMAITVDSGEIREVLKTDRFLFVGPSWNADKTAFVTVTQSSLMPDELVKVDLASRKIEVMAAPNAAFVEKELPEVRFMRIDNRLGGGIFGRLVLPNGYVKGNRYPLIITTYRAGTRFLEGAIGDEFPILPFAAAGFAVFAMDTGFSNMVSDSGDLEFTLMRLKRPLDAMEVMQQQLVAEGIIHPEKCAITGLSYGSEIASYAISRTKIYKAASVASSGLDPTVYMLISVNRERNLATQGYPYPEGSELEEWKKLSIASNGANIVTPLLIQSSDSETLFSLETFKALRHYGVPVDWYVYTGEGHVKSQPLNKYYVYRRNLDWMKFWLKDEVTSDPDRQDQYSKWRAMKEAFQVRQLSAEKEQ
jgi:dipeptidyl aminopeptidase/acylaminoacyl peptidase